MRCFPLWVEMFSIMGVRSPSCSWPWCGLVSSTLRCCQSRQSVPPGSVCPAVLGSVLGVLAFLPMLR